MGSRSLAQTDILFWNARGIKSKKCEFLSYLEVNNIPIALVNETHLQPTTKFKCPNYITYRSDRLKLMLSLSFTSNLAIVGTVPSCA
jgi:hypothetical protein